MTRFVRRALTIAAAATLAACAGPGTVVTSSLVPQSANPGSASGKGDSTTTTTTQISPAAGNTAPSIKGAPVTQIVTGASYLFQATASDADGDPLTFRISGLPEWASFDTARGEMTGSPGDASAGTTADIIISVTDGKAVTSLPAFRIQIAPRPLPPIALPPGNREPYVSGVPAESVQATTTFDFQPEALDPDSPLLTWSIVNKPDWASFSTATGRLSGTPVPTQVGRYANIVIAVTDGALTSALPAFAVDVTEAPNHAPSLSGTPDPAAVAYVSWQFHPTASDADGERLVFSIANLPPWASFDVATGSVSGTPGESQIGIYPGIVISASDGLESTALPAFDLEVRAAPNTEPSIWGTPDGAIAAGETYQFIAGANDPDGQPLTFAIDNRPAWATFNASTGELTGTPEAWQVGTYPEIVISVSDTRTVRSLPPFAVTVEAPVDAGRRSAPSAPSEPAAPDESPIVDGSYAPLEPSGPGGSDPTPPAPAPQPEPEPEPAPSPAPVNQPPTIGGQPATEVVAGVGYGFTASASDPDGERLVFWVANAPAWASFDTSTGTLSGTPAPSQAGTYGGIVVTVSDGLSSASLPPFAITVQSLPNRAPTVSGSAAGSVTVGSTYQFQPTAADPDGQPLTFAIRNRPAWASFDPASGSLSGTPNTAQAGTYADIVITASDGSVSTSLDAFTIIVQAAANLPPSISGSPQSGVAARSGYEFTPLASDPEGQSLAFAIRNRPSWASFDPSSGRLAGVPSDGDVGSYGDIVITVTDGAASRSLLAFSITVAATPPTGTATLEWARPGANEDGSALTDLAGYRIYQGPNPSAMTLVRTIGDPATTTATFTALPSGWYYFAVTAYSTAGVESAQSSVGSKFIP